MNDLVLLMSSTVTTRQEAGILMTRTRIHPAWFVAATAFVALIGAAGFRAAPGALFVPLHDEFGWSTSA